MWGPGLAAVVLQLLTRRSLAGPGWRPGPWRYWLLAVALPLAYAGPAYLAGWLSGLAPLRPELMAWIADVLNTQLGLPAMPDWALVPVFVAAVMTLAMAMNLAAATGEEIGWRGWLQPALSQRWGPRRAALAVGAIWAAWHWPGILFDGDHASTPVWFGGAMFPLMILAMSVPLAWLTWRSGSLWPAAVFHGVHSVAIQGGAGPGDRAGRRRAVAGRRVRRVDRGADARVGVRASDGVVPAARRGPGGDGSPWIGAEFVRLTLNFLRFAQFVHKVRKKPHPTH